MMILCKHIFNLLYQKNYSQFTELCFTFTVVVANDIVFFLVSQRSCVGVGILFVFVP